MRARVLITALAVLTLSSAAVAESTVSLTLQAAQTSVAQGGTVDWSIYAEVTTVDGDFGIALVCCDLVQDPANPALFDIPPASEASITGDMAKFNRPAGISNPGEGSASTGYIGVQRGTAGAMNLIQIGGGQNTFGAAGTTMGQDFTYAPLVGHSGAVLVVSGSFTAPMTDGTYTFSLQNGIANVLDANNPPNFTPVSPAAVDLSGATMTVEVGAPPVCPGDANCDDVISWRDIDYFVAAQNDNQASWEAMFAPGTPSCQFANNDANDDGTVNWRDIDPFVALMNTTCP
jgi:hypothetical protein